jgi:SRSO17 transposase
MDGMETTSVYQQVKDQEEKLAQFLKPFFVRPELLRAAIQYMSGLLNRVERKNTWQLAAATGLNAPYTFQHLLGRVAWDSHALRDHLQIVGIKEKKEGILVIGETAFLKKGNQSAGVARQYNRTSRRWENAQMGLFLAYASGDQQLLIDRELYIPPAWFADSQRCKKAKVPENLVYRTKPELAQCMLTRAFAHGIMPAWVVANQVYGVNEFRSFLEQNQCAYLLGIPGTYQVRIGLNLYQVSQVAERVGNWQKLSSGNETKAAGYDQWQHVGINSVNPAGWGTLVITEKRHQRT